MKTMCLRALALGAVATLVAAASPAYATVSGTIYLGQSNAANLTGVLSHDISAGSASAKFTLTDINIFSNGITNYTPLSFLNNSAGPNGFSGFTNLLNGFNPNQTLDNTIIVFSGTTYLNAGVNSFLINHDDGVFLKIPGIGYSLADGGPSQFTATPFDVTNAHAAGEYAFTLEYAECCVGPAGLNFKINGAPVGVPEPASLAILGTALLGVGVLRRKRGA